MTTPSESVPQEDPSEPGFAHGPIDPSDGDADEETEDGETEGAPGPDSNETSEPTA